MSFHLLAWTESIAQNAFNDLTPVPDGMVSIVNSHFMPQRDTDVLFAAAMSANLARVRWSTPSLRLVSLPFIRPINLALLPPTNPAVADYRRSPMRLRGLEEIAVEAFQTGAGAEQVTVVAGLRWDEQPLPAGDPYIIRWTGTTTVTANAWTQVTPTFDQTIPAGVYALVWSEFISTTAKAHRFIIENQIPRPGLLGAATIGLRDSDRVPAMGLGEWGRFRNTAMPIPEVLCNAADTAQEGYMTLIRVQALSF